MTADDRAKIVLCMRAFCQTADYFVRRVILKQAEGAVSLEQVGFYLNDRVSSLEIFYKDVCLIAYGPAYPFPERGTVYQALARQMQSYHVLARLSIQLNATLTETMIMASWFDSEDAKAVYELELLAA